MNVPFLDLRSLHEPIRGEIGAAIEQVLESCAFAGGPFVEAFEAEFAAFCQADHAIGVGSGTEALWLALLGLGVGAGDEVITVPNTFIATAEAISFCGATPVFVDIDPQTYTMDPEQLEAMITPRTKVVIPVHMFGQVADMDPIMAIAGKYGLRVIEDACQAHGAEYKGRAAGSMGAAGCFSFYPGKNLGAIGEAGAVVTNDAVLAEKIKSLRDHGQTRKYLHRSIGWNARMDGIQAAVLSVKLKHLDAWNDARRRHAKRYAELLHNDAEVILPVAAEYGRHVYHIFAIRADNRDALIAALTAEGVGCGIHYPSPVHLQQAYAALGLKEQAYPKAERCASELVSLPMFPDLTDDQVVYVSDTIKRFLLDRRHPLTRQVS